MKALVKILLPFSLPLALSACANLKETVFGHNIQVQALTSTVLGMTTRAEILKLFGEPTEIDQRQFENKRAEVYFYQQRHESKSAGNSLAYCTIVVEFSQDKLNGYWFEETGDASIGDVDEAQRDKLVKGRTTRQHVADILGIPTAKTLLPTTLTLAVLSSKFAGLSLPLAQIPESSKELWQYQHPNFDNQRQKTAQKTLSLFFDAQGVYLGSVITHELALQTE